MGGEAPSPSPKKEQKGNEEMKKKRGRGYELSKCLTQHKFPPSLFSEDTDKITAHPKIANGLLRRETRCGRGDIFAHLQP